MAIEKNDRLFMDDLKGRRTAELYRVETTTTLGIILELFLAEALDRNDYIRNVKEYGSHGWISGEILNEFLERGRQFE